MAIETWCAFVVASAVMLVIPGPTILAVISYSLTHGRNAKIPLITAVALGDSTAVLGSVAGLGALFAVSAFWFTVVKVVGGMYLLYLGIKMLRAGLLPTDMVQLALGSSRLKIFINTYLVTAFNPKGIVFFAAFLPQFITPGESEMFQMLLLGATFVVLAIINVTLYAMFAASACRFLHSPDVQRRFHFAGGALLSAAGVWALLSKRPSV